MGKLLSPTAAAALAQKPLDPDMEFDNISKELAQAEKVGTIEPLTSQERTFISLAKMGLTQGQSARGAGMTVAQAADFVKDPRCIEAAKLVQAMKESSIVVTKDLLTFQYYEAMSEAETAGEKIRGLDSVAKLHEIGGFARQNSNGKEGEEKGATIEAKKKKLATKSDASLIGEAGYTDSLEPEPVSRGTK